MQPEVFFIHRLLREFNIVLFVDAKVLRASGLEYTTKSLQGALRTQFNITYENSFTALKSLNLCISMCSHYNWEV